MYVQYIYGRIKVQQVCPLESAGLFPWLSFALLSSAGADTLVQVLRESAVAGQGPDAAVSRTDTGTVAVADADDAGVAVATADVLVLVPA